MMIVFGPIPSRRLGRSLGINNIPPKICSYSCVYCQIGSTRQLEIDRRSFYDTESIFAEVQNKVAECRKAGEAVDYLSFVPDGEPTLDVDLGKHIERLRDLGIRIAVITNGSLMSASDVRWGLMLADWVGFKIDAVTETAWGRINRPHKDLSLPKILSGMYEFAQVFGGILTTQTMLIRGCNDSDHEITGIADFTQTLNPAKTYISVPTRPPAEDAVKPADEGVLTRAYQMFTDRGIDTELMIGSEGTHFTSTGNIEDDILGITSVHPVREDGLRSMLEAAGRDWSLVESMLGRGLLREIEYMGSKFYLRNLEKPVP
jgi:wyosine [tRNA(Phe)-imidazoG37] synthetase (radical SAM superfamily)